MTDDHGGIATFVAIGDSFTEGLQDPHPDGSMRGWADRLAELLAGHNPSLRYANLAVRGKLLDQIVSHQLPVALAARADLISFSAGGNDILRPGADPDAVAERYEQAVITLRSTGARVLVFTGMDTGGTPILRLARGKIATYNEHLRVIAARHDCDVIDLWGLTPLHDRRAWSDDRLHLSPAGHDRVSRLAAHVLGLPAADPHEGWPDIASALTRREDLQWAREYFLPWIGRRLRHRSTGDGLAAKRPDLEQIRSA